MNSNFDHFFVAFIMNFIIEANFYLKFEFELLLCIKISEQFLQIYIGVKHPISKLSIKISFNPFANIQNCVNLIVQFNKLVLGYFIRSYTILSHFSICLR